MLISIYKKYKKYLLFLFFFLQYLLFRQFINREILPVYPIAHDQVIYLNQAFEIYKALQSLDLFELIRIFKSLSTGIFLQFLTGFLYLFFGPSREIALNINFVFFTLLQLSLLRFSKVFLKSNLGFYFFVGLLLSLPSLFHIIGGIFDFRLDFAAFCLNFIILLEILIFFYEKKRFKPILFVIALTVLFYLRTNLLIVYSVFFVFLLIFLFLTKKVFSSKSLIISFITTLILAFPFVFVNFRNLYNYYYVGHIKGNEVIYRKAETNTFNKFDELIYYPKSIYEYHLTPKKSWYLLFHTLYFLYFLLIKKRLKNNLNLLLVNFIYGLTFFSLYTLDEAKSSVIGINLTIPLLITLYILFKDYIDIKKYKNSSLIITAIVILIGLRSYFLNTNHNLGFNNNDQYLNVAKLMRFANYQVRQNNINEPRVATFYANELSERLMMFYYMYDYNEFKRYIMTLGNTLGGFLGEVSIKQSNEALNNSNIVLYNLGEWQPDWIPFNKDFKKIREVNTPIVEKKFCPVGEVFDTPWGKIKLYIRPSVLVETSGDWLLNKFTVSLSGVEKSCLKKFNAIELKGDSGRSDVKKISISMTYLKDAKVIGKNNLDLVLVNNKYKLNIPIKLNNNFPDSIEIFSNNYFVPKLISDSEDIRKLLLFKPLTTDLD